MAIEPTPQPVAWQIAQRIIKSARQSPALLIAPDATSALALFDAMRFYAADVSLRYFPDWETLPYDSVSPHKDLIGERIALLHDLVTGAPIDCVITTVLTASQRIAPVSFFAGNIFTYHKGDWVDREMLRSRLVQSGYDAVSQVVAPGEFSVRGSVFDIFPAGEKTPFRLDFFDDEIDSIASFDPETQRSNAHFDAIGVLPGREFSTSAESFSAFKSRFRARFTGDPTRNRTYRDIANGVLTPGIEYFLPLFFEETASLFDFFTPEAPLYVLEGSEGRLIEFANETRSRFQFLAADASRALLTPDELYLFDEGFEAAALKMTRVDFAADSYSMPTLGIDRRDEKTFDAFKTYLSEAFQGGYRLLVALSSTGRLEGFSEILRHLGIAPKVAESFPAFVASDELFAITTGDLAQGAVIDKTIVLTERELYGRTFATRRGKREKTTNVEAMIRDLAELKIGDPVVHASHGIGRYAGLKTITSGAGVSAEFVQIDYAQDAKLFLPVTQIGLLSRYSGADPETAPMHHLGRGEWAKAKSKAAQKVWDTAAELLELYARRNMKRVDPVTLDMNDYERFAAGFTFEETPDQKLAIEAVLADLAKPRPMDRLICGDVGFGKTEVALRAAFAAVMAGKQVAILCPTTLLAEQHARTFAERFAAWPVNVKSLSRFTTSKATRDTVAGLATGEVDIVIGTHRLLSQDIAFARLGLLVIDEEHRFGVRQKEKLKALRADVGVLTLTATPIPRTLAMSLEGIREFSVITTAPEKRLSIKTFLAEESPGLIREAVLREIRRAGQVYFLHNDVATIKERAQRLAALLPEVTFGVAHGQMPERELEAVMRDFYAKRFDVLICSSIIENGLDVANANTIIITRADRFGLAQLHQLRGRVGRSKHQAYAYLLVDGLEGLSSGAQKRLDAIRELEELGSGFYLAMHDMEIRGAGEVLGEEQSGEIETVGYDLYNRMLSRAVKSLKTGQSDDIASPFEAMTEINLHAPTLLPEDYVQSVSSRLNLYKDLAAATTLEEIENIRETLADRFGRLPEAALNLIELHRVRLSCEAFGIERVDASDTSIQIAFGAPPKVDIVKVIQLAQSRPQARLSSEGLLRFNADMPDVAARLQVLGEVFKALSD